MGIQEKSPIVLLQELLIIACRIRCVLQLIHCTVQFNTLVQHYCTVYMYTVLHFRINQNEVKKR